MFFYVLVTPALIASLYMIHWLRNTERHDRVLFKLCGLRREMMSLLRRQGYEFSREDYFALRELIEITNKTIHNYKEFKNAEFSIGKRIEYGTGVERLEKEIQRREVVNPTISALYNRFAFTMFLAVVTFIPWPDFLLKVVPIILRFIAVMTLGYFNANIKRLIEFFSWLNQKSQEYAYR